MYPYKALLTLGTLAMTLGVSSPAKASSDIAISFELPPSPQAEAEAAATGADAATPAAPVAPTQTLVNADAPLPIPAGAENPPMAGDNARPAGVYGGLDAITIGAAPSVQALLPPPPPVPDYLQPLPIVTPPPAELEPAAATPPPATEQLSDQEIQDEVAFRLAFQDKTFEPPQDEAELASTEPSPQVETVAFSYSWDDFAPLFAGGTDSLVAWAVGSAEGTRTPNGHKNPAYYGHVDPGNGVWNMGTFSYQHGARTPEEADNKQLRRLQSQTAQLRQKAQAKGLTLSQEELLNGIDLANQAPLAALDRGGYLDWLHKAHNLGMQGQEAIVWARTRSFIDPDTQRWNAPGLGNNVYSISHDQERRAQAIARAIAAFTAQTQIAVAPAPSPSPPEEAGVTSTKAETSSQSQASIAFGLDLPSSTGADESNAAIATATATEENTATATIEQDEQVVSLADPATGLLLFAAPSAAAPHETLASAALKSNRPVLSRLSQTLSRIFPGRQSEPAAAHQGPAIAAGETLPINDEALPTSDAPPDAEVATQPTPPPVEPVAIAPSPSDASALSFAQSPVPAPEPAQAEAAEAVEAQPSAGDSLPKSAQEAELPTLGPDESRATPVTEAIAAELAAADTVALEAATAPNDAAAADATPGLSVAAAPEPATTDEAGRRSVEPMAAADPEPAIAATERVATDAFSAEAAIPQVPQQSTAPVSKTDAVDLGRTLDSLNQFQRQLRQELGT